MQRLSYKLPPILALATVAVAACTADRNAPSGLRALISPENPFQARGMFKVAYHDSIWAWNVFYFDSSQKGIQGNPAMHFGSPCGAGEPFWSIINANGSFENLCRWQIFPTNPNAVQKYDSATGIFTIKTWSGSLTLDPQRRDYIKTTCCSYTGEGDYEIGIGLGSGGWAGYTRLTYLNPNVVPSTNSDPFEFDTVHTAVPTVPPATASQWELVAWKPQWNNADSNYHPPFFGRYVVNRPYSYIAGEYQNPWLGYCGDSSVVGAGGGWQIYDSLPYLGEGYGRYLGGARPGYFFDAPACKSAKDLSTTNTFDSSAVTKIRIKANGVFYTLTAHAAPYPYTFGYLRGAGCSSHLATWEIVDTVGVVHGPFTPSQLVVDGGGWRFVKNTYAIQC